jgi:hypothetical protein
MDELDLLLETLDDEVTSEPEDTRDSDMELALAEFSSASSPKDRLEALKLLVQLMK